MDKEKILVIIGISFVLFIILGIIIEIYYDWKEEESQENFYIQNAIVTKNTWCSYEKYVVFPESMDIIIRINQTDNLNMTWVQIVNEAIDSIDPFDNCGFNITW